MPNCENCSSLARNENAIRIRTKKGFLEPGKRYCMAAGKPKVITPQSTGNYGYPVWCPLNTYMGTCIQCGTRIREEEGEYCKDCR